jgi:hypothetical protein
MEKQKNWEQQKINENYKYQCWGNDWNNRKKIL